MSGLSQSFYYTGTSSSTCYDSIVHIHCVPKKHVTTFSTITLTIRKCPITIIFGIVSSKSMRHGKMASFPTSPI